MVERDRNNRVLRRVEQRDYQRLAELWDALHRRVEEVSEDLANGASEEPGCYTLNWEWLSTATPVMRRQSGTLRHEDQIRLLNRLLVETPGFPVPAAGRWARATVWRTQFAALRVDIRAAMERAATERLRSERTCDIPQLIRDKAFYCGHVARAYCGYLGFRLRLSPIPIAWCLRSLPALRNRFLRAAVIQIR